MRRCNKRQDLLVLLTRHTQLTMHRTTFSDPDFSAAASNRKRPKRKSATPGSGSYILYFFLGMLLLITACQSIPDNVTAIRPFDKNRYLGKWYEIARFDFRFEEHMNNTTAFYAQNEDGSISVLNQGYDTLDNTWQQARGKAKFVGADSVAMLKVSFFGPFYAGYNVIALDPAYQYAMVCGGSRDYLWILSREKSIPDSIRSEYLALADRLGFDTSKLIWVMHDRPDHE